MAEEHDLKTRWGRTGFSLNVEMDGKYVAICFCYSSLASFGPAIYTSFKSIEEKVECL